MDDDFVSYVRDAAFTMRSRNIRELGKSDLIDRMPALIQQELKGPVSEYSAVYIGNCLIDIFLKTIRSLKPVELGQNTPSKNYYLYLRMYIDRGAEKEEVERELELTYGDESFDAIQDKAIDNFAAELWKIAEKARDDLKVLNNLHPPMYKSFIPRYDENENKLCEDVIIPYIIDEQPWIITIIGDPGIGKSSLAYACASCCIENKEIMPHPFEAVIWIDCRQEAFLIGSGPKNNFFVSASIEDVYDEIGSTLKNREVFQTDLAKKQLIVQDLLNQRVCLFIIDNLDSEWITEEFREDIEQFIQRIQLPHRTIVTLRRDAFWDNQSSIRLVAMTREESNEFLKVVAEDKDLMPFDPEEFEYVYKKTHGVPLAMKQVLSLTRSGEYLLEEALNFDTYSPKMLGFMYRKAYKVLPEPARCMLHSLALFKQPPSFETLAYTSDVLGPDRATTRSALVRGNLIERIPTDGTEEARYTLLPFMREFLRTHRTKKKKTLKGVPITEFLQEAQQRMTDYYIQILKPYKNSIDRRLLELKYDKKNMVSAMQWCFTQGSDNFFELMDLIGVPFGILRRLKQRKELGLMAVELCRTKGREDLADWYLVRDVAWSLVRIGTDESRSEGRKLLEEVNERTDAGKSPKTKALALRNLSRLATDDQDYDLAQELLSECRELWTEEDQFWKTITMVAQADLQSRLEQFDESIETYEQLRQEYVKTGDTNGLVEATSALALVHFGGNPLHI